MSETSQQSYSKVRYLQVDEQHSGQRIDNYLRAQLKGLPKTAIYKLLRKGQVRVNKRRIKAEYRLQNGDEVRIPPIRDPKEREKAQVPEGLVQELDNWILHEDEYLMALNKPAGLAVHKGTNVSFGLIDVLRQARPNAPFLELVHRLDRETSGCLLIAKSRDALLELHDLIRDHQLQKRYLALVANTWRGGARQIETGLQNDKQAVQRKIRVEEEGRLAISYFKPLKRYESATLMEIEIKTGRTHQIRVQAAHLEHPILGDRKYGNHALNREWKKKGLKRMFLHAHELSFQLPVSGRKYDLKAPLDDDLSTFLEGLK
jgi:23S rRNA pseudouridine955/2504/2580 synthase